MRKSLLTLVFALVAAFAHAQQHVCAQSKLKSSYQKRAKTSSTSQTNLMNKYDVKFQHLNLSVERDTTYIYGNVRLGAQVIAAQLDTLGFELHQQLTIDSILLTNGSTLMYDRIGNFVYTTLPTTYTQNEWIDVTVYYHGNANVKAGAAIGSGFSTGRSSRWGNQATWSLSQPYSAYEWFPCKQALQDKVDSVFVYVTTANDNKVGSNGVLIQTVSLPNNKVRYEWQSRYPIDYYLISLAVGKYVEYKTYAHLGEDSLMILDYVYDNPQTLATLKPVLDQTADMLEAFSNMFGKYPFWSEKYGHVMAPFSGGMEHQTMTSIGVVDFGIVAHELGHQWFGDHVTCQTWSDIWLNEGFATYTEYLALEALNPANAPLEMGQQHYYAMEFPGGSVWVDDTTNVERIFSSQLSYNKGSAFVHTLRFEVNNDSLFFALLRAYQQRYAYATASTNDFKKLLEEYTQRDFTQVFNQWFYGQGYPTFNVSWYQQNDTLYLRSKQTVSSITPLFITPVELKLTTASNAKVVKVIQNANTNYWQIPLAANEIITGVTVDPNNWLMNTATVTKDPSIVGIEEKTVRVELKIYPNPVNDLLHVHVKDETTYSVYNQLGQCVLTGRVNQQTISVEDLKPGIYLIISEQSSAKFIKN